MAKLKLQELKTSELVVDKFNVRGDDWDNDEELVDSIKSQGVLEPLLVRSVKGQSEKYPKNKTFSIVCGNRRWHGAMEGRLKTIPCVIRNDLDDLSSLGISLQENLERKNLDTFQIADTITRMWDLMNGDKKYDEKVTEIKKRFGIGSSQIDRYRNIQALSEKVGSTFLKEGNLDTHTLSGVEAEKEWDDKEKKEALKVLETIDSERDRGALLSEMKARAETDSPKEALEKIKKEMKGALGITLNIWLNAKERAATFKACKKQSVEMETLVKNNHVKWLKDNKFLK